MTATVEETPEGLPTWALRDAWDMALLLGGLCPAKEERRAQRRTKTRIQQADEETTQLVRRGMVWMLTGLAHIMVTPGHPAVQPPGSPALMLRDVMGAFVESSPVPVEYHGVVRTILEHGALDKNPGVWDGRPEHTISAGEMAAIGWALWMLADLNDTLMGPRLGQVYYTHRSMAESLGSMEKDGGR